MHGNEWRPELLASIAAPLIWAYLFRALICIGFVGAALARIVKFDASVEEFAGVYHLKHPRSMLVVYITVALVGSFLFISGWMLWLGACALGLFTFGASVIAFPFWKQQGLARKGQLFPFMNHLSLAAAFFLIAWYEIGSGTQS